MAKKQVILDTNFLIYTIQYKIDLKGELSRILPFEYEICFLDRAISELKYLEKRKYTKLTGKIALAMAKKFKLLNAPQDSVDDSLIQLASKDVIIATQDQEIKKAIKTPVIIIRQKRYMEIKNYQNY